MAVIQKILCEVDNIINHGDHVYTVVLKSDKKIPRFNPGQFLHLALDDYDPSGFWPDSRPFSIASSPDERNKIRISYSVQGRFTSRMENELKKGNYVWIKMPFGDFTIEKNQDTVLYAGGTGITAFTAFLEELKNTTSQKVCLFYGARSQELLIYLDFLETIKKTNPNLFVFYYAEKTRKNQISIINGKIPLDSSIKSELNLVEPIYYIAGPPLMIKNISNYLEQRKIDKNKICIDLWE